MTLSFRCFYRRRLTAVDDFSQGCYVLTVCGPARRQEFHPGTCAAVAFGFADFDVAGVLEHFQLLT